MIWSGIAGKYWKVKTMTIRLDLFVFHLFARRQFGSKGVYQFDKTQLKFQSQRCETRARVVIVTLRKCSFVLQRSGKLQLRQVPSGVTIITSKLKLFFRFVLPMSGDCCNSTQNQNLQPQLGPHCRQSPFPTALLRKSGRTKVKIPTLLAPYSNLPSGNLASEPSWISHSKSQPLPGPYWSVVA